MLFVGTIIVHSLLTQAQQKIARIQYKTTKANDPPAAAKTQLIEYAARWITDWVFCF